MSSVLSILNGVLTLIICDTHALIFWAVKPDRLSRRANAAMEEGRMAAHLACADISLWEIAMLAAKGRITPPVEHVAFIADIVQALRLQVLSITPEIAVLAQAEWFSHGDPADRLIAATALHHKTQLITADEKLAGISGLNILW